MQSPPEEWEEVGKWKTAVQTFLILAAFVVFIAVIGDWKFHRTPQRAALAVSLLPSPVVAPPKPAPTPVTETPKPKAPAAAVEADIALQKKIKEAKAEQKKRNKEERDRKNKKLQEERDAKKKEQRLKNEQRKEQKRLDELKRLAEIAAEQEARAAALEGLKNRYIGRIINRIERYLITPPTARGVDGLVVVVVVHLDAAGNLLGLPEVVEPSAVPEYDEATFRAVLQAAASPFDTPKEPELLEEFRTLRLYIKPE